MNPWGFRKGDLGGARHAAAVSCLVMRRIVARVLRFGVWRTLCKLSRELVRKGFRHG